MPASSIPYPFHATPWHYTGTGGWVFVSLPQDMAEEIRALVGRREECLGPRRR